MMVLSDCYDHSPISRPSKATLKPAWPLGQVSSYVYEGSIHIFLFRFDLLWCSNGGFVPVLFTRTPRRTLVDDYVSSRLACSQVWNKPNTNYTVAFRVAYFNQMKGEVDSSTSMDVPEKPPPPGSEGDLDRVPTLPTDSQVHADPTNSASNGALTKVVLDDEDDEEEMEEDDGDFEEDEGTVGSAPPQKPVSIGVSKDDRKVRESFRDRKQLTYWNQSSVRAISCKTKIFHNIWHLLTLWVCTCWAIHKPEETLETSMTSGRERRNVAGSNPGYKVGSGQH